MSYYKSKKDITDMDQSLNKAMDDYWNEWWDDWDDWYSGDWDDCSCGCCGPHYDYKEGDWGRDGRMVDLDSLSKERKRNSIIGKILGEYPDGKTTIGDICQIVK